MLAFNMKRAYLIHGWAGGPHNSFRPWLKKELEKNGYQVHCPQLPDTNHPTVENWVGSLRVEIQNPDEDTVLVGHSLGCKALMLYLADLPASTRVGALVLVAGTYDDAINFNEKERRMYLPWKEAAVDYEKIRTITRSVIAFFDDSDTWIPLESSVTIAREQLGADVVIEHDRGHYSDDEGKVEVPRVLEKILQSQKIQ